MTFNAIWQELETATGSDAGYLTRRVGAAAHPIYLGVERPTGRRTLIFPMGTQGVAGQLPTFAGFALQKKSLDGLGTALVLTLQRDAYAAVFQHLVSDVVDTLIEADAGQNGLEALLARLGVWQECLRKAGDRGLGAEAQRGLFGELHSLETLVLPVLGPGAAVAAWTGPSGEEQDFRQGRLALEIKTTMAATHPKMSISSARQLDDRGVDALVVGVHLLNDSPGGDSLTDRVCGVRTALAQHPHSLAEFEERLLLTGYCDAHAERYHARYTVFETRYFKVSAGFPRITEEQLPEGVGDVRYTVSLAACLAHTISREQVERLLGTH